METELPLEPALKGSLVATGAGRGNVLEDLGDSTRPVGAQTLRYVTEMTAWREDAIDHRVSVNRLPTSIRRTSSSPLSTRHRV